jgi:hypothetical protein
MNTLVNPHSFRQILVVAYFGVNALVSHTMSGQLAPSGAIHVQQPNGVHYIFGTGGTHTGGGFFYVNYLTGQYDVIGPVSVSANGSFFGSSGLTGLSVSGQVYSTSITLTYNGTTVSSNKESLYGPSGAFAGNFLGPWTESSLGVGSGILANSSDGTSLLVSLSNNGVNIGVGSIDSGGHIYITSLAGESISTTFAPVNGIAQGTASSSFGYQYTYSATKAVPFRLAWPIFRRVGSSAQENKC